MNAMNPFRFRKSINHFTAGVLALGLALFVGASNSPAAQVYLWTNTASTAFYNDPGNWSPVGGPGGPTDTASFTMTGTFTLRLTNNLVNLGSFQFGAGAGSAVLNLTLDFGTNIFAVNMGGGSSASGCVFGQQGTSIVYMAVGTMLCTNGANPTNARFTIGRNNGAPAQLYLTNGNVVAGTLVMANNAGATPSKLVISGSGSSWSNNNAVSIGNVANANLNSLVISNSASMTTLGTLQPGFSSPSHSNSVLVDFNGTLFTRGGATIGAGAGSLGNKVTVQGGGLWDNNGRAIAVGNATGGGNMLLIGSNGTVSNLAVVTIAPANSMILSGGVITASQGYTNTSGTVGGFGTIVGSVVFATAGTLSPGVGTLVGTLSLSNDMPLLSTSTTIVKLDKSQTGSNDSLNVVGTLTEAGTLTINNTGPALVGGDTFNLFTAGTASGDFSTTNLPSLSGTLIWNTSSLHSGTVSVILPPSVQPIPSQAVLPGSNVIISAVVTGVPDPTLQWQLEGTNLVGQTSATLSVPNASTNDAGTYCLIASNIGGSATNCMSLVVCQGGCPPTINGLTDQTVIQGNNGSFNASVAGLPTPSVQWQQNSVDIPGATGVPLILTNVQYSQDGFVYSLIASNEAGVVTSNATLHVIVTPSFTVQPTNFTATVGQAATFTAAATGVPPPTYQWQKNNSNILNATNATFSIASVQASDMANYRVVASNTAGSTNSNSAFLTVLSTMTGALTPANGAMNVCYDTPLYIAFSTPPLSSGTGKIQIFVTNSVTPVDTIDTSLGNVQSRTIGTETFNTFPVIITTNVAVVYPHLDILTSNQAYYVTVDPGTFTDTNGALFAGITTTNGWVFTTKPTGPANPNNVVVAADGSGDFCTVQGAVDSLPTNNTTYTLINIHNGDYNELVDTRNKNNMTFRGQDRKKTIVGYHNNDSQNSGTHNRMAFKVFGNDIAVENMTITNRSGKINIQAEALMLESNIRRFICNNAEIDSYQDTILGNTGASQGYFKNSLIQGDTDFIWGAMNAYFTNCQINCLSVQSHVTQARTDDNPSSSNGMAFVNCQITRASTAVTNCDLGRTLGFAYGNVIFKYCLIDVHITGWSDPSLRDWEFQNSNITATAGVSYNGITLTNGDPGEVCADDSTCWLYGWVPQLAPNIIAQPTNFTVNAGQAGTFTVSATGVPDPTYQWLKNGATITGATSATLTILNAQNGDNAAYSVIVSNVAGTMTSSNATLTVIGTGATASFTASPISGTEPLGVTFTDTSTGSPGITLAWNFGDMSTSNTAGGATVVHTYAAGTYTVTLTASNSFGSSTLVSNNLITVITAFQAWQLQYFGSTNCPTCGPNADYDGDGQNNLAEFIAGTDPTNAASALEIQSVARSGNDIVINWQSAIGKTNAVQASAGDGSGNYTNTYTDISGNVIISGSTATNYTDVGGGTNSPSHYYRIRLVP